MKKIFLSVFLLLPLVVSARTLTPEDRGYEILFLGHDITTFADGREDTKLRFRYRILSEQGVQTFSIYHVPYNANTQTVVIERVEVKNPEGVTAVDPKNIEEKSIFGGISGFDETKTKVVALPNIKVGSEITIEYDFSLFHPPFQGVLSDRFDLFFDSDVREFSFKLVAPAGAALDLHDPSGLIAPLYKESQGPDGGKIVTVAGKDLKGIATTVENASLFPDAKLAWLDVSNLKSFEEAGAKAAVGFDKILSAPVPERWKALFGPKPQTPLGKEEALTRLTAILRGITDNFRYFGDWRSVDGGYVPRPLAEVDQAGYGDCKDFAVMSTVAARYLGLTAEPVLVHRNVNPYQRATIPSLGIYNHAIARVQIPGSEAWWWVDATNRIPQIGLVPLDIAGRSALSIGPKPGRIEIPRDDADHSTQTVAITIDPSAAPDNRFSVDVSMSGEIGWSIQNQLLSKSQKQIEEFLIGFLGVPVSDAKDFKLAKMTSAPDDPYTVAFRFDVTQANGLWRSGDLKILPVIMFGDPHFRIMDAVPEERGSDLMMDALKHVTVTQKVAAGSFAEAVGSPQSCTVKTPWLEYSRKVVTQPEFSVVDEYRMLKYRIAADEIKTPEFSKAQRELRDCLKGMRVVVK
jgi:hypothetical protein